ncbi:MAG: fructosamine kinase family protein [Prochlorococcaceae cyanobacterium]|jgi:fructosamine-3-kinase
MLPPPIAACIRDRFGEDPVALEPLGGGCTGRFWGLRFADGRRLFAKTLQASELPLLEAEADGLGALAAVAPQDLAVPRPLLVAGREAASLLVLEWLPLAGGRGGEDRWHRLGRDLAALHRRSLEEGADRFGWPQDNWIGAAPQRNGWCRSWAEFFRDSRLGPQLEWAARSGRPLRGASALLERLPRWLEGHDPEPVLVHGDLWSGNAALLSDGRGAIFDPAVHRADREVDLAMARLFGGFPPAFFAGYGEDWPLAPGHRGRADLYNLYHLLNHANLFGGGYRQQAQASLDALLESDGRWRS